MKTLKVSIVIPNYNGRKIIKECVDAVLRSDYSNLEIIIVDNGSTDGSYEYLQEEYGDNEQVKILRLEKNVFFTGANNYGAQHATGEKILLTSNDIVLNKNCIKELVVLAKKDRKHLVQPKIMSFWQKDVIDNVGGVYRWPGLGFGRGHGEKNEGQYDGNARLDFASSTTFMIDRRFFLKLGGQDDWYKFYYEDVDLSLRAKKQGGECWFAYKAKVFHKGSLTVRKTSPRAELLFHTRKNILKTVLKNYFGWEKLLRLLGLLPIYLGFSIQDLLSFKKERVFLTAKSVSTALHPQTKSQS